MDDLKTNDVDRARAQRVAADAWLRPTATTAPDYGGGERMVNRSATQRRTPFDPANPLPVVSTEVQDALRNGWTLVGIACDPSPAGAETLDISIGFEKNPTDMDHAAIAILTGRIDRPGSPSVPPSTDRNELNLAAYVPHHGDKGWPDYPAIAVDLAKSCIADSAAPTLIGSDFPREGSAFSLGASSLLDEHGRPEE